jgi:hypothetical protein
VADEQDYPPACEEDRDEPARGKPIWETNGWSIRPGEDERLQHLSPTRFRHVDRYGRYRFDVERETARSAQTAPHSVRRVLISPARPFLFVYDRRANLHRSTPVALVDE